MANYQKIANINGSATSLLKGVKQVDSIPALASKAVAKAPSTHQKLVAAILEVIEASAHDQAQNEIALDSRLADVILMRIASLLEVFKKDLVANDLTLIKDEILDKIESQSEGFISNVVKEYLAKQLVNLFDKPATKDDIEDLKHYLIQVQETTKSESNASSEGGTQIPETQSNDQQESSSEEKAEEIEDAEEGPYLDSTPAKNFFTLQTFIGQQFEALNATIAKMTTSKVTPSVSRKTNKMMAAFAATASVIQKAWDFLQKIIQPAIDFVKKIIMKFVVVPILMIALKIGLIIAAITLIAVGIILAVKWIKDKLVQFWNYIASGEMWEDIKAGMLKTWEWMKDFGKWLWDITVKALKYIFVDVWVELGKWVWEKLCQFGRWLYDNYINPYIIQPFMKYIWNPFKKFVINPILKVINKVWNYIKGIIDDFKNGKIMEAIWKILKGYLLTSLSIMFYPITAAIIFIKPIRDKVFELIKFIEPFVKSAEDLFNRLKNLGGFIKDAITSWWNGDSSLGDTLKNIGTKVWDTIVEWWNGSIFKEYWDKLKTYLNDLLKPLKDWWNESWLGKTFQAAWTSLKEKWDAFKQAWDEFSLVDAITSWWEQSTLKSCIDTIEGWIKNVVDAISNFGTTIKESVVKWYEESSIKKWIDKFVDLGKIISDGLNEWYDKSLLKSVIDKIKELLDIYVIAPINGIKRKIAAFVAKLATEFVIKVPKIYWKGITNGGIGLEWVELRPFDFATKNWTPEQKQQAKDDAEKSVSDLIKEEMDKTKALLQKATLTQPVTPEIDQSTTTIQNSQDIANQVVTQQMQPLQEMEQRKAEANASVDESFASVAKARQVEQERQQEQQDYSMSQQYEMFQFMKDMRSEMKNGFANPQVVPAPIMITNNNGPNPAMMENR